VNVKVIKKPPLESLQVVRDAIGLVEEQLGSKGRVLVRYSGTENICRVMVEGQKQKQTTELANAIALAVSREIGMV
jgi:phosphoglucosamine mutase